MQITTELVTIVGTSLVTVGGMVPVLKKYLPKVGEVIKQEAPVIAHDVNVGIDFFKNLAESPLFAGKVAVGKLEAHHVISQLEHTTAVSEAKTVLLGVGKVYDALTSQEKVKAEVTLRLVLSQLGVNMTDTQIQGIFGETQKAIDVLQGTPMFKASFDQPAPAETQPTQA